MRKPFQTSSPDAVVPLHMRSTPTRQSVRLRDATMAVQTTGEGPPVLLIHGLSGSTRWWRHNINSLAEHFKVYSIDLLGFGASRGQRFMLDTAADSVVELMEALQIERTHIVGHSMGGAVAADIAALHPARVDRLVLVDAALLPFGLSLPQHARGLLRELRHVPLAFLPILFSDAALAGPTTFWRAARAIMAVDARERLPRITAPTLIIWGERDAVVPLELGQALAHTIAHGELVVLEGAGHNAMWDKPHAFNDAVLRFLLND